MYLVYLVIVLPYALFQAGFAASVTRRRPPTADPAADAGAGSAAIPAADPAAAAAAAAYAPAVDVVITCYGEDPALLTECCASVAAQDYPGPLRIFVVDDGSPNAVDIRRALDEVRRRHPERDWTVILSPRHVNKRATQDVAFRRGSGEIMVTVDSDTVLHADAVSRIVELFADPEVGGVCGNVHARNARQNLLTGLLDRRYQHLFEQERAAQSRWGAVLCCSGPLSGYRRSVLEPIWDDYITQSFLGHRCVTGDDIHLTVLVLRHGATTRFASRAHADTQVPASLGHYCRQQLRWQRSMYRELAWMVPMLPRWNPYIALDIAARVLLPFLLAAMAMFLGAEVVMIDPAYLRQDAYLLVVPMLVYAALVLWQVGDLRFLAYAPLHLLLVPFKLYAVLSLASNSWMTPRGRR
jgi:N-acetylglucosaminyltransferase